MTEKGGMVVREIDVGRDLTSSVPIHAGIIPIHKNHVDVGTTPVHKNHVDAGTVPIPENHVVVATIPILKSRVDVETVHIHADMLTGVRILQKSNGLTTLLWML